VALKHSHTQKLAWNDTNKPIDSIFWWQGLDGSRIFTYFPNEIGQGIEPEAIAKHLAKQEAQHNINQALWLYGVGDHGGGPTADMLDLGVHGRTRNCSLKWFPVQ
jgi:alpha-mannosidase